MNMIPVRGAQAVVTQVNETAKPAGYDERLEAATDLLERRRGGDGRDVRPRWPLGAVSRPDREIRIPVNCPVASKPGPETHC
jgi:hypothetical protein